RPGSTRSASGPGRSDLGPDPLAHGLLEVEERVDERVTRGDHLPAGLGLLLERLTEVLERPGAEPVLLAREPERLPGDLVRALGEPERLPLVAELEVRAPHGLLDLEARLPVGLAAVLELHRRALLVAAPVEETVENRQRELQEE